MLRAARTPGTAQRRKVQAMRHPAPAALFVSALLAGAAALVPVRPARAETFDAMLDTLQYTAFQFFWNEANPANGLIKDRNTSGSPSSIASVGFGLSGICIGVDHGWVSRADARQRVLTTLNTFWTHPQGTLASGMIGYKGFFYHFLDMTTALRTWDSELSTIDTALLLAGILDAKQFFDDPVDPDEIQIRALADMINQRMDWRFMQNFSPGVRMGWKPGTGFSGFGEWIGYNEAMVLYILALGSPTFAPDTTAWDRWTSGYQFNTFYGQSYVFFPPLFGHQYSHCWIDFRNIRDEYMRNRGFDYFENSRRATYAARAYCADNPFNYLGYSDSLWGLTAGDGPDGYEARGAPPTQNDDGTITPTAAISSIPFAPEIVEPFIRNLWNNYRDTPLWGPYAFNDGFNLQRGWFGPEVIGIDQGPILIMIENYRTGRPWARFMANPEVQTGLARAGFLSTLIGVDPGPGGDGRGGAGGRRGELLMANAPIPFSGTTSVRFRLPREERVTVALYDMRGRRVATAFEGVRTAGEHAVVLEAGDLASGVYRIRLSGAGGIADERTCVIAR